MNRFENKLLLFLKVRNKELFKYECIRCGNTFYTKRKKRQSVITCSPRCKRRMIGYKGVPPWIS